MGNKTPKNNNKEIHPQAKKSYVDKLISIVKEINEFKGELNNPKYRSVSRQGKSIFLNDKASFEFQELLRSLLKQGDWGEKFSEKYLDNALVDIIFKILADGNNNKATLYFTQLESELNNFNREYIVFVPLVNIDLKVGDFQIGQVELTKMTESKIGEIIRRFEFNVINANTPQHIKNQSLNGVKGFLIGLSNEVCVKYVVIAESERARERAIEEAARIIDLFRFSLPAIASESEKMRVGIQGDAWPSELVTQIISSDITYYHFNLERKNPVYPLEITEKTLTTLKDIGFFTVSDILKKQYNRLTNFEDTLLRGIHWFSSALNQAEAENKFLNLTTCLETFLTGDNRSPITNAIAEGIAFILSDDKEERKRKKQRVIQLYGMRSGVSHGGHKVIYNTELKELQEIAYQFIKKMISFRTQFQSKQELLDWIEDKKFS